MSFVHAPEPTTISGCRYGASISTRLFLPRASQSSRSCALWGADSGGRAMSLSRPLCQTWRTESVNILSAPLGDLGSLTRAASTISLVRICLKVAADIEVNPVNRSGAVIIHTDILDIAICGRRNQRVSHKQHEGVVNFSTASAKPGRLIVFQDIADRTLSTTYNIDTHPRHRGRTPYAKALPSMPAMCTSPRRCTPVSAPH